MNRLRFSIVLLAAVVGVACTGARATEFDDTPSSNALPTDPNNEGEAYASGSEEEDKRPGSSGSTPSAACKHHDNIDHDGDGLSYEAGDCNDCDPNVRPGRIDVPGNGLDEDCSGKADDDVACDASISISSTDARDAAKALGLCKNADPSKGASGVVSARYVKPDGTTLTDALSWGVLDSFGPNMPRHGSAFVALSTGVARAPGQLGYKSPSGQSKGYSHTLPAGFPKASPACPADSVAPTGVGYDGAALELVLRVPIDAKSMSFDHDYFTYGYSTDVCSKYADTFIATMTPPPPGVTDENIVFDSSGGPISVSSPLIQVCEPGTHKGITFACGQGTSSLKGTGFDGKAATGWLRTTVPVTGGSEIKLTFMIWDSGDGTYDSTVLVDAVRFWSQGVAKVQTLPVP
jgi:hypothetical protein